MAERNSKWCAMGKCFIFFLKESVGPTMRSLVKKFVIGSEEYFTKRTKTGELGFAIEKLQNGKFNLIPIYVNENRNPTRSSRCLCVYFSFVPPDRFSRNLVSTLSLAATFEPFNFSGYELTMW
jgi:hypothetical protein